MIVIPMAGLSKRFTEEGYSLPKFMLKLHGISLFKHSISSFKKYFESDFFLFISLNNEGYLDFLNREINELGIKKYEIILLKKPTSGQAETVFEGIKKCSFQTDNNLTIFNIDTIRLNFELPEPLLVADGYLEVFVGTGSNWSYVKTDVNDSNRVIETAEKKPISNLCCTGLYFFKNKKDFIKAFIHFKDNDILTKGEIFVAPLYNYLIKNNKYITYNIIKESDVIFCGTPMEYLGLLSCTETSFYLK